MLRLRLKRQIFQYGTSALLVGLVILALVFVPFDANSDGADDTPDDDGTETAQLLP